MYEKRNSRQKVIIFMTNKRGQRRVVYFLANLFMRRFDTKLIALFSKVSYVAEVLAKFHMIKSNIHDFVSLR